MWVAAAPCRRAAALVGVIASAFVAASAEPAAAASPTAPATLPQIWAVELNRENARLLTFRELRRVRASGINALLLGPSGRVADKARARRNAERAGLLVFAPLRQKTGARAATAAAAADACRSNKAGAPGSRCAVLARSAASARLLAADPAVDIVFVRIAGPSRLAGVRPDQGRVVALPPLTAARGFARAPWGRAIRLAQKSPSLDLAVKPSGASRRTALRGFSRLLSTTTKATDKRSPTPPTKLAATDVGQTEIAVSWSASKDKSGILSYGLYVGGKLVGSSVGTSAVFSGLPCGAMSLLEVDAVDPAGNRSRKAALQASTQACGAAVETLTPLDGATVAGAVTWEAAVTGGPIDEVRFLVDGQARWTERNPPYLYEGDPDGWDTRRETNGTHMLTVVAYLEGGGTVTSTSSVTVANGGGGGDTNAPSAPTGLALTATDTANLSIAWNASTDDVGVLGYGVYRNGASAGTTGSTAYAVGGLACGTTYTLAVDAFDAAGNRSAKTSLTGATSACEPPEETDIVYVSTNGSDSNGCTKAAPCKTFDRAYRVADPGDVVEVAGGAYPGQTINVDSSKTASDDVLFRPAAGAAVTLSSPLTVYGRHLELRDMTFRYEIQAGASDVTLRNIVAPGRIRITSNGTAFPRDIAIIGGEIGPGVDSHPQIGSNGTTTSASPTNILFDGVRFHDFTISPGSSAHVECLQVWAVDGLTIRNSRFENCYHFDIFLQKLPGGAAPTPTNILIENNFLDCCGGGFYSIRMSDTHGESWRDVVVRNNSSNKALNVAPGVPYSNVKFISNIAPMLDGAPKAGVTVDYNIWYAGSAIGPNDRVAPHGFRDAANRDFHLVPGAAAIDAGSPADHPSNDIDGQPRPLGAAPDAGADEADGAGDTEPPSTPTGLAATSTGQTSIAISWNPSTDNVGVASYRLYRNGSSVGTTGGTAYTFSGLTCGQTYAFAVDAADAAGNRSATASVSASTSACPPPGDGATLRISPTGSDANDCSPAAPCKTFNRAYQAADPGDVVEVLAGTYPSQTIASDASKTSSADVVFRPAPGATVTIDDDLNFQSGSHITIEDLRILDRPYLYPGANDVTLRRIVAAKFFLRCAHYVSIVDSEFTDRDATGVPTISAAGSVSIPSSSQGLCPSTSTPSKNVLLDNVYFHEIWRPEGDTSSHRECLHVMGVDGLVIRNSRFHECLGNTAAVSFNIHNGSYIADALVENNFFWKTYDDTTGSGSSRRGTGSGTQIHLSDDPSNGCEITIRYNTMSLGGLGVTTFCPERGAGIVVDSNIFEKAIPCSGSGSPPNQSETYTWRNNVAQEGSWASPCNSNGTNKIGSVAYASLAGGDLRLAAGAFPIDKGNPATPPPKDHFGTARPMGAGPDAGAHERG